MGSNFYSDLLRQWDWKTLVEHAKTQPCVDCSLQRLEGQTPRHSLFLGSILTLSPSGKYYSAWANGNVTKAEAERDEAWFRAFDKVGEKFGFAVESGEGDPCDLFITVECPKEASDVAKVEETAQAVP
jgi:hypothetical protein